MEVHMHLRRALLLIALPLMLIAPSCVQERAAVKDTEPLTTPEYLTPELREAVEQLKADVDSQPTDADNILARSKVLWRWANAYALTGRPIHPELPSSIAQLQQSLLQEGRGQKRIRLYGTYIDWFVKEFAFRDDNPGAIGKLTTPKLGPYFVDTYVTITQTYTVGSAPIKEGGGVLVAPRYHGGGSAFQWQEPAGEGYVSVQTSNPDVVLETTTLPVFGMFSGGLGGTAPRPYFRVAKGELNPGDEIMISIGDQRQGGKGLKLPSASNDAMRFKVWVSLGNPEELFTLAELPFYSVGGKTAGVRGFGPSIVKAGEPVTLIVRSEDVYRNRATSGFPKYDIYEGDTLIAPAHDSSQAIQRIENIRLEGSRPHLLSIRSTDGSIAGEFNPILVEDDPSDRIYWGETHGHSGFAEGSGTVDGFFKFAREDAGLDFMTLSEHDLWMDDFEWEVLREATIRDNAPGEFITFLGYEWTTPNALGGHHNILFRMPEDRDRVPKQEAPILNQLYSGLKAKHDEKDVVVIPHAHNPGQWWISDPSIERLVEIVSNHGTFEWLGRAYLSNGFRLGFIGGSDDHIGHPGLRPISTGRYGSDNFGGLAAVMAHEKSRNAIFDSLQNQNTYATNGFRMILKTAVNGTSGKQTIAPAPEQTINGRTIGSSPIDSITLIKNGKGLETIDYQRTENARADVAEFRFFSESDPYQKGVKSRGWRVWRGRLRVINAEIEGIEVPNVENTHREFARVSSKGKDIVEFFIRTRGAPKSIILKLKNAGADTRFKINTSAGRNERFQHSFTFDAMTSDKGDSAYSPIKDHQDEVKARFVATPTQRDRRFEFSDAAPSQPGDSYYVRVIQTNGGMAWSSPVWVD